MLFVSDLKDVQFQSMYRANLEGNKIIFEAYINRYGYCTWEQIGFYNIENKEGKILLAGYKEYKWYKSLKSIWNSIYKVDQNASMTSYDTIINKIKDIKKVA